MFPLKAMRYKIQAAPTPEEELLLQEQFKLHFEQGGAPLEGASKQLLTTGWLATAEEALQMFKELCG
jgi:hypothetical protein